MHEPQGTVIGASRLLLCDLQPIRAPQLSIHPQQPAESEGGERGVEGREREGKIWVSMNGNMEERMLVMEKPK